MKTTRNAWWIGAAVIVAWGAFAQTADGQPASAPAGNGGNKPAAASDPSNPAPRRLRDPRIVKWRALTPEQRAQKLTQAQQALQNLFGEDLKRVAATGSKADDLELAQRLLKTRQDVSDDIAFVSALCRKALELAEPNPAGSETVLAAVGALTDLAPEDRPIWMEKIVDARQKAYFASRGSARVEAAESLAEAQRDLSQTLIQAEKFNEATAVCRSAVAVLRSVNSDQLPIYEKTLDEAQDIQKLGVVLATLRNRLARDPKDQLARNELIRLYVVEQNDPQTALSLMNEGVPEDYRENLPDASKDVEDLDATACQRLGQWYQGLTDRADDRGKKNVLGRAQRYYEQYLDLHTKADVTRLKVDMELKKVVAALDELNAPPKPDAGVPFRQMLVLDPKVHLATGPNRFTASAFQHRCFEAWVKPGEGDGLIYDQGNTTSGMAVAIFGKRVYFAMGDGKRHTKWVTDKEGPRKGKRREVPIPAGVLSAELPDRDKWFHVVAQFSSRTMALFLNGTLVDTRRVSREVVPGTGENTAVGGGERSNAGYWSARNFGGKIGAFRVSNRTRYAKSFDPEAIQSPSNAYMFLCADRMLTGKIDKFGTRDSASSTIIKWIPIPVGSDIPVTAVE